MSTTRPSMLIPTALLVAGALLLTACSSSSPSTKVSTHAAGVPYLTKSGTGNTTLPATSLPSAWTLIWHFSCTNPSTRRPFVLVSAKTGGSTTTVTNQTGLEGGGYHPFHAAGEYTFTVTTSCSWQVVAGTAHMQTIPTAH